MQTFSKGRRNLYFEIDPTPDIIDIDIEALEAFCL
jgi:hypothetical protein